MYCELHGPMGHGYAKCPLCDAADASPEVDRAVASAKEKLRLNPDLQDSIHTRIDRALLAEHARANELQASLDLRWKADMRAIELWRAAGQGRELTLPDHADLCVWLLEQGQTSIAWKFGYAQAKEEADMDKRFCPHCNPCNHDGNGKCRAPEMTAPPRDPTPEMIAAGLARHEPQKMSGERLALLWRAMYDAAPAPSAEPPAQAATDAMLDLTPVDYGTTVDDVLSARGEYDKAMAMTAPPREPDAWMYTKEGQEPCFNGHGRRFETYGKEWTEVPLYAAPAPSAEPPAQAATDADALAQFTAYFVANYPGPKTIIMDPRWHAPRIFRAAQHAMRAILEPAKGAK